MARRTPPTDSLSRRCFAQGTIPRPSAVVGRRRFVFAANGSMTTRAISMQRFSHRGTAESPPRREKILVMVLFLAFVASRAFLLLTSSERIRNWEEPVFLFSALRVQDEGWARVWDYQDDLNHGGSVPLILAGAVWLRWVDPSVLALKWMLLVWWTISFAVFLWAAWSIFSPRAAVAGGFLWVGASPDFARLQVTLVGSHPEAVLPALLGTVWLAGALRAKKPSPARWILIGSAAATATWMSYLSVGWSAALCAGARFATGPRWRRALALGIGISLGALPWLYQNVYLRPHGALLWLRRVGLPETPGADSDARLGLLGMLAQLPDSLGPAVNGSLLVAALAAFAALPLLVWSHRQWRILAGRVPAMVPVVALAAVGSACVLAIGRIPLLPGEGYYYSRFFAPLLVLLFLLAGAGVDVAVATFGRWCDSAIVAVLLGAGVANLAPLYGQGVAAPSFREEYLRGCLVYGVAEFSRAGSPEQAVAHLARFEDVECRRRAFGGLGWGLADAYIATRSTEQARRFLDAVPDPNLRRAACGGMRFVLARSPRVAPPVPFPSELERLCQ